MALTASAVVHTWDSAYTVDFIYVCVSSTRTTVRKMKLAKQCKESHISVFDLSDKISKFLKVTLCVAVNVQMCFTSESLGSFAIYFHDQYRINLLLSSLCCCLSSHHTICEYVTTQNPSTKCRPHFRLTRPPCWYYCSQKMKKVILIVWCS